MESAGSTWDKDLKQHTCCGSQHTYHKSTCVNRRGGIPGRMSDPDFLAVQACKADDLNSFQCARRLNMPVEQVNDLWLL